MSALSRSGRHTAPSSAPGWGSTSSSSRSRPASPPRIGVPLGILAARRPRLGAPLVAAANVVQTVPSLAMFGFLLPVPLIGGVGARAALVVLILYGCCRSCAPRSTGVAGIDRADPRRPASRWG